MPNWFRMAQVLTVCAFHTELIGYSKTTEQNLVPFILLHTGLILFGLVAMLTISYSITRLNRFIIPIFSLAGCVLVLAKPIMYKQYWHSLSIMAYIGFSFEILAAILTYNFAE
ncbi:hypothetical protein HELRODRAFT_162068 [Helobdella robusta]|uniref:Uncharacterized protein n=1 Tax=Helobdella robusta TaxID=6412 RepID=T1ES80_HELRO|nr:hypothetical protein HELRODRAFT_162068 [Helobdella robusta]ESN98631.1 hypothetical protein HELRODRAFT_162068 [Helobdella robusta]